MDDVKAAVDTINANQENIAAAQEIYNANPEVVAVLNATYIGNQELVDSVLTPENIDTAAAIYEENKQAADSLVKSIFKFIFPFAKATNQRPFAAFFTALVENMKASEAIKDSPATQAVVNAVTSIIDEMDPQLDPFNAAAKQANDMANALLGSAVESMPNIMGAVLNLVMSTQSRSIGSTVNGLISPLVDVVKDSVNLITTVASGLIGGTQKTISNSLEETMNCFKHIKSDNGFLGTLKNSLVCAETVLNETYNTANGIADVLMDEVSFTFMSAVNGVNARISGEIEKRLPEPFKQCGLGVTQTSTMVAQKLDDEIEGCVHTEVATVLNVLTVAKNALGVTAGFVDAIERMSNDCLSFRIFSCGWAVSPFQTFLYVVMLNGYLLFSRHLTLLMEPFIWVEHMLQSPWNLPRLAQRSRPDCPHALPLVLLSLSHCQRRNSFKCPRALSELSVT